MRSWTSAGVAIVLVCSGLAAAADDAVDIFNGKDLDGWVVEGTSTVRKGDTRVPIWTVQDGMISCAGSGFGFLRYDKKKYSDFVMDVEYRMSKDCNSGVGIRTVRYTGREETRPSFACYEIQILDDSDKKPDELSSGSLYRYLAPKVSAAKPAGEWNAMEITCQGPKIHVVLNGQTVQDVDQTTVAEIKDKPLSGYVCLQNHGSKIEFRKVQLKELPATVH